MRVQSSAIVVLKTNLHSNHLDSLSTHIRAWAVVCRDSAWICSSNKLTGDASTAVQRPTSWDPLMYRFLNKSGWGVVAVARRARGMTWMRLSRKGWQLVRGERAGEKMKKRMALARSWKTILSSFCPVEFVQGFSFSVCSCSPHYCFFFHGFIFLWEYL